MSFRAGYDRRRCASEQLPRSRDDQQHLDDDGHNPSQPAFLSGTCLGQGIPLLSTFYITRILGRGCAYLPRCMQARFSPIRARRNFCRQRKHFTSFSVACRGRSQLSFLPRPCVLLLPPGHPGAGPAKTTRPSQDSRLPDDAESSLLQGAFLEWGWHKATPAQCEQATAGSCSLAGSGRPENCLTAGQPSHYASDRYSNPFGTCWSRVLKS